MTEDSETLRLIEDSGRSFAADWGGIAPTRKRLQQPLERDRAVWKAVVDQGWIGLMVPETKGGLGLSARALITLAQQLGRGLMTAPVLPAIATSVALARMETTRADALLAENLSGARLYLASLPDLGGAPDLVAEAGPEGIHSCLHDSHEVDGVIVFDIERGRAGCLPLTSRNEVTFQPTIDGGSVGSVAIHSIPDEYLVASRTAPSSVLGELRDLLAIGSAAMLIGCAKSALDISIDYLKTRKQFGAPIGSFQALQHRAATLHVRLASTESFLCEASSCFDGPNRSAACAAVRSRAADCALDIVKEAVQFHGAIGFADEHDIGLYFRRVIALAAWHGNSAQWRKEFFATAGLDYSKAG
jgi:alkylation response protein AidB-like acyl-CoA dehydrogenase